MSLLIFLIVLSHCTTVEERGREDGPTGSAEVGAAAVMGTGEPELEEFFGLNT